MSGRDLLSERRLARTNATGAAAHGSGASLAARDFRERHGDPADWTAEEYENYLDLPSGPGQSAGSQTPTLTELAQAADELRAKIDAHQVTLRKRPQ